MSNFNVADFQTAIEIQRVLVLSTGHLQEATARAWDQGDPGRCVEFGYLVWACDPNWSQDEFTEHLLLSEDPPEVKAAMRLAFENRCSYIRYDCDGPLVTRLAEHAYEW